MAGVFAGESVGRTLLAVLRCRPRPPDLVCLSGYPAMAELTCCCAFGRLGITLIEVGRHPKPIPA